MKHRALGVAEGIVLAGAVWWSAVSSSPLPRMLRFLALLAVLVWAVVELSRWRRKRRELLLSGIVALLIAAAVLGGSSAGRYHAEQELHRREPVFRRVAEQAARDVTEQRQEVEVTPPFPDVRWAVARPDPDTGGIVVQFAYRNGPRSGVIVYVDAKRRPEPVSHQRCLRRLGENYYEYHMCK